MKQLTNRLVCMCRGHEWEAISKKKGALVDNTGNGITGYLIWCYNKCTRCGKVKEE